MKQFLLLALAALPFLSCQSSANNADEASAEGAEAVAATRGDLYLRTYMWTGMYGTSLDISWIYMDKNGNIVRNPKHGVNPVDWAKEKLDNAKNTGTYKVAGEKINITWSDGKSASWSVEKKDGKYSAIDGGITTIQDAMPANYRIEGKYASSIVLPNVAATTTLVFKKDGTFTSSNYGTVTTPDVTGSSEKNKTGTYDITGNTLTMKFPDGKVEKSVITIWDDGDKKNLVINGGYYPQE